MGYDSIRVNGKRKIVVNETGKLIRKAFYWKAEENLTTVEIRKRLAKLGFKLSFQGTANLFTNVFYCGYMAHNSLEGQLIEGTHEKMVSKEIFMKANEIHTHSSGYKIIEENDHIPLKRFLRCDTCGRYMRGYLARKKNIFYYKCNNKCSNNLSSV